MKSLSIPLPHDVSITGGMGLSKNYPFHIIKGATDSIVNYNGNDVAGVAKVVANAGFDVTTKPGVYANMMYMYKDRCPLHLMA